MYRPGAGGRCFRTLVEFAMRIGQGGHLLRPKGVIARSGAGQQGRQIGQRRGAVIDSQGQGRGIRGQHQKRRGLQAPAVAAGGVSGDEGREKPVGKSRVGLRLIPVGHGVQHGFGGEKIARDNPTGKQLRAHGGVFSSPVKAAASPSRLSAANWRVARPASAEVTFCTAISAL